jgi:hypothetical protein
MFGGNGFKFPTVVRTAVMNISAYNFWIILSYSAGSYPIQGSGVIINCITLSTRSSVLFSINNAGTVYQGTWLVV